MVRDLAVPQTPSVVVPKKTLREPVTPESAFQRDNDSGIYVAKNPVANILKWEKSPIRARRIEFKRFIDRKRDFDFSLDLVLRLTETNTGIAWGKETPLPYTIKCPFTVKKLPWTYALPWNKRR
jgi:hypothetical protein